ncbi:MAG: Transcriptional regulator, AcrR family, partial [uncultured Blastococcus sp.]
ATGAARGRDRRGGAGRGTHFPGRPATPARGRPAQLRRPDHGGPRGLRRAGHRRLPRGHRPPRGRRHRHAVPQLPHPARPLRTGLHRRGRGPLRRRPRGERAAAVGRPGHLAAPVHRLHRHQARAAAGAEHRLPRLRGLPRGDVRRRHPAVRAGAGRRRGAVRPDLRRPGAHAVRAHVGDLHRRRAARAGLPHRPGRGPRPSL